jgi:hypothetical protein
MGIRSKNYGSTIIIGDLYLTGILRITSSTYLFYLTSSGTVVETPEGPYAGATRKKIKILIDDVAYYLLAANDWVTANSPSISPSASVSPSASSSA